MKKRSINPILNVKCQKKKEYHVVVRIFSPKDADSQKVATELRNNGFGVTLINGEGMEGEVSIAWCVAPRKKVRNVLKIVSEINPDAYVTTESTNPTKLTGNRK